MSRSAAIKSVGSSKGRTDDPEEKCHRRAERAADRRETETLALASLDSDADSKRTEMNAKRKKKIAKKPVKKLSESERLAWLRSRQEMARLARVNRECQRQRWGGTVPEPQGDYPTSTMTREEVVRRTDLI
jgi:hypothetical protein